jgi:hypothetical protein
MRCASGQVSSIAAAAAGGSTCCSKLAVLLQHPFRLQTMAFTAPKQPVPSSMQPLCKQGGHSRTWTTCHARGKTDLVRSIRVMPIKLVRVSKDNSKAAQDMAQEWLTKLSRQVWLMQGSATCPFSAALLLQHGMHWAPPCTC